jgi:hypothetical protein
MTIQPNSAADNAAQLAAQAFLNPKQNQAAASPSADPSPVQPWNALVASVGEDGGAMDSATSAQLTQQLAKSMFDNAAASLQAQSGANPQSVLDLIQ